MGILSDLNEKRKRAQRKLKDEFLGFTSSASRKLIPRELRPALPFLSAAVPFMVPAQGIFAGPLGRALLSSGTNLLAQGLSDPEAEDLNLLSASLAGLTGALSSPEVSGSMRSGIEKGVTGVDRFGDISVPYTEGPGFLQGAENIGREGIASMSDFVTGTGETFKKFGRDPGALFDAGVKGARFPGLKELGTAITIPAAQGTGDFAYTEAQKALRAFNDFEAEEMARAGADMEAIASARRSAIREAMEVSGFEEDEIMETLGELGLKQGGIVSLAEGGMLDFGGKEMDLRKGGFVPIGKKEKADDVPARLSKNEFVMTADAVRAAGGGSVNKGAQRMYDLMNNLEARA